MNAQMNPGAAAERSPVLPWPVACWTAVLLLIGIVQIVRAQWFDTAVFFGAAALVVAIRWLPPRAARRVPLRAVAAGAVAAGVVVSLLPRHSGGMDSAVVAIGVAAVALAWPGTSAGPRPWTAGLRRLGAVWAALVIAGCVWELVQFIVSVIHPADPSYALSNLLDPLLDGAPGRIGFVAVWLAGGMFLLRGGGRR
ncbi:hypothetical protein [Microbacterium capsulatum]|uniref:Uncharacterized protein n=1 Tax=Microbacterium capsulatum TaxID=3041921 RepID=A0ABU0XKK9_9MICO|nr:hypothetical protein [Microbacterium sp. ASV81]MDQ4215631.1 hypothetical protein [Microbacterium sp. ASV81]